MSSHKPRKRFGQHFLSDPLVIEKIVSLIAPSKTQNIIEIGPGEGVLTQPLLDYGANLTAIEIDRDLAANLATKFAEYPNFKIINEDVLKCDVETIVSTQGASIVGNLPYNISTPLLIKLFSHLKLVSTMVFMLQKEVVDRMCALHGNSSFGRLTIFTQTHCKAEHMFDVPPAAFSPPPKVDSAIVKLKPLDEPIAPTVREALSLITQRAFSQRRKKLKTGLKNLCSAGELATLGIDPEQRPDTVSVESYLSLAKHLVARQQ